MAYDNLNKGALFKNDKRDKAGSPDYKGTLNVGGEDYWISGWLNESKNGVKYFGLQVTKKEQQAHSPQEKRQQAIDKPPLNDEIPF